MSTSIAQIFISNIILWSNEPGLPEEMVDLGMFLTSDAQNQISHDPCFMVKNSLAYWLMDDSPLLFFLILTVPHTSYVSLGKTQPLLISVF